MLTGGRCASIARVGEFKLPESQKVHGILPDERNLLAGRRVSGVPIQLPGRVTTDPGRLC